MANFKLLWEIFIAFVKIDCICFGGAYAAVPVVQRQVVEINQWLTMSEFMDLLAIDELTPGPIIINCATFIGNQLAGIPGAVVATLGIVIPTSLAGLLLIKLYLKYKNVSILNNALSGIKSVVCALLISAAISFITSCIYINGSFDYVALVLAVISFILMRMKKLDNIVIIVGSGIITLLIYTLIIK